jgi:hypothetical protein
MLFDLLYWELNYRSSVEVTPKIGSTAAPAYGPTTKSTQLLTKNI